MNWKNESENQRVEKVKVKPVPLQEKVDEEAKVEEVEMERDSERARWSLQPRSHQTGSASCRSLCCAAKQKIGNVVRIKGII